MQEAKPAGVAGLPYTRRPDGKIAISLDNNVWDFLFDRKFNMADEFPCEQFAIFMPREVEIEWRAIPAEKAGPLKAYIAQTLADLEIRTTANFGFFIASQAQQRHAPMGFGTFQSDTERQFYDLIRERFLLGKGLKGSGLSANEGDAAVAAASFSSVVLTCEWPDKSGPLKVAAEHGGRIVYLYEFDERGPRLRERVINVHRDGLGDR